jgi:hypothetical protein
MLHVVKQIENRIAGRPQSRATVILLALSASALAIGLGLMLWK